MRYDLGGTHPMDPGRLEFTMALARDLGVLDRDSVQIVAPQPASTRPWHSCTTPLTSLS